MTKPFSPFVQAPFLRAAIIVLVPFFLLALIYFVVFPNDYRLQAWLNPCSARNHTSAQLIGADAYTAVVDFRVLLGVLTLPSSYERRALLRLAYKLQPPPSGAAIDVRFVFCNVTNEEDAVLVAMEIIVYDDILVLNCTENMNDGKTYDFFSAVPRLFADQVPSYDYVGKVDDDIYYRVGHLADTLRGKPRQDMYHGFLLPCDVERKPGEDEFMAGWGYIVSWDVAVWISETEELGDDVKGPEDMTFRRWLRRGGKGKNLYGEDPARMYDYLDYRWPDGLSCFRHALVPDTIAVHYLKNRFRWARTLKFFNVTMGLKPSKLYHLDL
ncbi:uncharacterized protein LOC100838462 [Brachypodium distachyon]|uniref:Hexosyltransferase n=1 Tax=Brachypodium distachyon TaxID=15368 RepID=I1HG26_BRADI|nr:uncharacterized protein LOC100838462 [Brachypodium distachyon]KQK04710.1 hypothetical protein BRADI_2g15450v3 [Brachypodium distachyon]|eukprot:XP_003565858.1 uncharacterized protein LOC100838462 [Brachypodium distachyon]